MIDEEKAAELMMLDQLQFVFEPAHCRWAIERAFRVALIQTRSAQLGKSLGCGRTIGSPEVGKCVPQVTRQIERTAALGDGQRSGDSIRTVMKQRNDFVQWPQVKFTVGISDPMRAVERRAMANSDHDIVQPVQVAGMIMNVARRYDAKSYVVCDPLQCQSEREIAANLIALDLDEKSIGTVYRLASFGELPGGDQSIVFQCSGKQAILA